MAKAQGVPRRPSVRTYQRGGKWYFDVRADGRRFRRPGGRTREEALAAGAQFAASGAHPNGAWTVGALLDPEQREELARLIRSGGIRF